LRFIDGHDVGQSLNLGWFDEVGHDSGFAQHVLGVELEAIQVKLDRAPGVRFDQVAEIVGELLGRELVNCVVEVVAHAPDGAAVGINGLGLQAFALEVFEMGLVALIKFSLGAWVHAAESSRFVAESPSSELMG